MKKIIYLISPKYIDKNFYQNLDKVLSFGNTAFFQLRLKNLEKKKILSISKKVNLITKRHKVKFILNDNYKLAIKIKADGCHMGQQDGPFELARKSLKGKILGITCHSSKMLAKRALSFNPNYIAFGSFNKSKLKPKAIKGDFDILKWANKNTKKSVVAIGGINNKNYKKLLRYGAKYIAISSFIWDNPKLKPELAIRMFK